MVFNKQQSTYYYFIINYFSLYPTISSLINLLDNDIIYLNQIKIFIHIYTIYLFLLKMDFLQNIFNFLQDTILFIYFSL